MEKKLFSSQKPLTFLFTAPHLLLHQDLGAHVEQKKLLPLDQAFFPLPGVLRVLALELEMVLPQVQVELVRRGL